MFVASLARIVASLPGIDVYVLNTQAQFAPPPKPEPCPPNLCLQQQYPVVKPASSYTGGVFSRVGVVDSAVLVCVLRETTKKGHQIFVLSPKYYFLEPPL